jgi:Uma2 family endonuclease
MSTVVVGTPPVELQDLLDRRRRAGADRLDEVWEGVYHIVPAPTGEHAVIAQQLAELLGPLARAAALIPTMHEFNLGESKHDFRVPDGGLHRRRPRGTWQPTAALVVEIASPGDETWQKLPFYAKHGVEEIVIVEPAERTVAWLALREGGYQPVSRSSLMDFGAAELAQKLDWP